MSAFLQLTLKKRLVLLLVLKALILVAVIAYAGIELGPDEAQYWTWSQALDWGYYSKPPGIAWQIWLGTQIFGQTEWGVRSITVLLAFFQALAVYQLGLKTGLLPWTAFWCGLCMAFCPLGILGSLFAITDVGFLLCWTGACYTLVAALHQNKEPSCLSIGGWILVGALFKWPIYLFWFFFFCCTYWYFPNLKKSKLILGLLLSLLGLLPSLWWNISHDWATFRHVSATVQGGSGQQAAGNLGDFLGSQAMLLSPLLFMLLICGLWHWKCQRRTLTPPLYFCGFVTCTSLGFITLMSCFQKIQGNWVSFAYPTGLIILGWYVFQQQPKLIYWAKISMGLSILLTSLFLFFPTLSTSPALGAYLPPYRLNPLKHNLGWQALKQILTEKGYDPNQHFLLGDKYQTTSLLSFYNSGQKRAYFLNLHHLRKNQFCYWPSLQEEQVGKTGYFIWIENQPHLTRHWQSQFDFYQTQLAYYFEKVEFLNMAPLLYEGSTIAKAAIIFRCQSFKDVKLVESNLY